MKYRQIAKLESTYVKALPLLINKKTGRIHSSFNQTVAVTGRLSSSNPNLQNIPIRTDMGKEIRKAFVAEQGYKLISADYSQIELRILALLSKDEKMIEAFKNNIDIHSNTASLIFSKNLSEITKDERRFAKVINFGLIYGMGAYRISNELNISRKEAAQFIENYFGQFPTIKSFIEKTIENGKKSGYVSTILGRRLYLPGLSSSNKRLVAESERVAINMPIQGSAADLIKKAMVEIHNIIKNNDDIKMIIQVHDELVFEVMETKVQEYSKIIKEKMENVLPAEYKGIIPLSVDIGIGDNWLEAH
jgi:DNA polymerase-1